MDDDRLFQDFDIRAAQAYRRWCEHVAHVNDARLARGAVRPAPRWYRQVDMLFLIAAALFAGLTALAVAVDPAALARLVGVM